MWCSRCGGTDHWVARCPEVENEVEFPKAKKPWVKPTLTRWVKAEDVVNSDSVNHSDGKDVVNGVANRYKDKEKRKAYMREYMRRVRDGN